MALLICSASTKELSALAKSILPDKIDEMQPMEINLKNDKAIFMATGVGPINAALAIGYCLGLQYNSSPKITGVLYAGLAGAFDLNKNPLNSIWRITEEIWPEYGLNDGSSVTARAFSFPLWSRKDGDDIYERILLDDLHALKIKDKSKAYDWGECNSLTVAGTTASFARKDTLWDTWHASLENMEGFAAAYACARAEIPFVEIRVVSNKVGPRSKAEKDFDGATKMLGELLQILGLV